MSIAGFTLNVMSLLALSLAVGLLIDDAIVVRENIFRRMELGEDPKSAARLGANEVTLAVIATTLVVLSVFGPVAFLQGIIGQFFKQFGLTICFAMLISLFDSLTMAPMLSAYFASTTHRVKKNLMSRGFSKLLNFFDRIQTFQEKLYVRLLAWTLKHPLAVLGIAGCIFFGSFGVLSFIPKTFIPAEETGEFQVSLDMPSGTSLEAMDQLTREMEQKIRKHPEVRMTVQITGGSNAEPNQATVIALLTKETERKVSTTQMKELIPD